MLKVKLENTTTIPYSIVNAIQAMRTCYSSNHLSDTNGIFLGEKDKDLLRTAVKTGHETPIEFIDLSFSIEDLTRAILQEFSRHRTQVLNVQSTRYTLKKMKNDVRDNLSKYFYIDLPHYEEYLNTILDFIDKYNLWELPNDKLKLYFPESLFCKLCSKMNLRNFFNFYQLRSSNKAHFLIRELAEKMYNELPKFIQELVDIYITKESVK